MRITKALCLVLLGLWLCSVQGQSIVDEAGQNQINTDPDLDVTQDALRQDMLDSKWFGFENTDESGGNAMQVLYGFPRVAPDGTTRTNFIPPLDENFTDFTEQGLYYGEGMFLMVLLPLIFSVMAVLFCTLFCACRCACNWCGGRKATQVYTKNEVNVLRAAVLVLVVCLYFTTALGWSANINISLALDGGFDVFDEARVFGEEYMSLATSIQELFSEGEGVGTRMNATLELGIPDQAEVDVHVNCTYFLGGLFDEIYALNTTLLALDADMQDTTDFSALFTASEAFDASLTAVPDLVTAQANLLEYNVSLSSSGVGTYPVFSLPAIDLTGLNTSLHEFYVPGAQTTSSGLTQLTAVGTDAHVEGYNALEAALAEVMPELESVYTNVTEHSGQDVYFLNKLDALTAAVQGFDWSAHVTLVTQLGDAVLAAQVLDYNELGTQIVNMSDALVNLNDSRREMNLFETALEEIRTFAVDLNLTALQSETDTIDVTLADLSMNLELLQLELDAAEAQVDEVWGSSDVFPFEALLRVNESVPQMSCMYALFDRFLLINETVFLLPDTIRPLLSNRDNVATWVDKAFLVQGNVTNTFDSLIDANTTDLPDFAEISSKLSTVRTALTFLSNVSDVYADMGRFAGGLGNLDTVTSTLESLVLLKDLVYTLEEADLLALNSSIYAFQEEVDIFPAVNALIYSSEGLNGTLQTFAEAVAVVRAEVASGTFVPGSATATTFLGQVDRVNASIWVRANSTAVLESLSNLNNTLPSTLSRQLSFLYDALILVDITNAVKEVETMNAERKTQDSAHSIVANNEYLTLNAGLTAAPNMTEALLPLNSVERVSQDNEIGLTLDRINELDFFLTDEELEDAIQVMRDVRDYKDQIFDIDYVIAEMVDNRLRFTDLRDDMTDFRDEYLLNRDELKETFSSYDGYRLLLFQLIMVLPLCLSMCGVCAMVFEMPCPSMLMSLLMFPLMSLVFFSAGVAMPAAAFLTDHCVDLEGAVSNQLSGRTYPAPEFFNLSTDLQMEEFFNYFSDCSGVRPEMLLKLDQPEELMADNDLNVTMMLQNLTSPPGNWNLTLTPKMTEYVIDMELMWDESMSLMAQTAEKFTCERTSNIYDTLFENVCMDFAPQFALSVSMYLICSLCMCPAVVIGAKGYKRFNPDNVYEGSTTVNVMDVDRHSDSDGEGGGVVSLHTFSNAGVPTGNDSAWGEDDRSY